MGYTLDQVRGQHHSMFVDEATRNSSEYREFWSKLNRGEFHIGQFRRLAAVAARSGCRPLTTRCLTRQAGR